MTPCQQISKLLFLSNLIKTRTTDTQIHNLIVKWTSRLLFKSLKTTRLSFNMSLFSQQCRGELGPCLVSVSNQLSRMNARPTAVVKETVETLLPGTSLVT